MIVISDPPHLLRVRYAWNKVLGNSGIRSTLVSGELSNWNAKRWWENDLSRRYVISEYLKLGYFIYEYHMGSRFTVHGSRLKNTDTDTHTGTDFDEKEHKRLRQVEKKWENRINAQKGSALENGHSADQLLIADCRLRNVQKNK